MDPIKEAQKRLNNIMKESESLNNILQSGFKDAMSSPELSNDMRVKFGKIKGEMEQAAKSGDKAALLKIQTELLNFNK